MDQVIEMMEEIKKEMEKVYNEGVQAGIKQMENKIQKHCELGKPVMANGELYFFQDSRQHLRDIMDNLDDEWEDNLKE